MKNKILSVIVVMLLITSVCLFAGGQKDKGDDQLKITFVTPLLAHPVWDKARQGFEAAGEELGFEAQYVGPQGIDAVAMIDAIETAIIEGVDGIITFALDPVAFEPVLKKAEEAGITLVLVFSEVEGINNIAKIGTSERALGNTGAQYIKEHTQGIAPKVIYMGSGPTQQFPEKVRAGYEEVLKDIPGYEVLAMEYCDSDMVIAMDKFEALFKTYPEANMVIGVCGEAGPAAGKVAKEFGITDDLFIMAIDGTAETMDLVKDGSVEATMEQNFFGVGYVSAKVIVDYVTTGKKPATYDINSGSFAVDASNMDEVEASAAQVMQDVLDSL
jgi:ABC-type sugar transport system substrate-binding protein